MLLMILDGMVKLRAQSDDFGRLSANDFIIEYVSYVY